jgi:hypothetical protein
MAGNARLAVERRCGVLRQPQHGADVGGLAGCEGVVAQHGSHGVRAVRQLGAVSRAAC